MVLLAGYNGELLLADFESCLSLVAKNNCSLKSVHCRFLISSHGCLALGFILVLAWFCEQHKPRRFLVGALHSWKAAACSCPLAQRLTGQSPHTWGFLRLEWGGVGQDYHKKDVSLLHHRGDAIRLLTGGQPSLHRQVVSTKFLLFVKCHQSLCVSWRHLWDDAETQCRFLRELWRRC
jgi:hypothetical protein